MTPLPPVDRPSPAPAQGAVAPAGRRPASGPAPAPGPSQQEVRDAIAETLAEAAPHAGELEFQVEKNETIVRVVDRETRQVVRQIPSEEIVQMRRGIERAEALIIRSKA